MTNGRTSLCSTTSRQPPAKRLHSRPSERVVIMPICEPPPKEVLDFVRGLQVIGRERLCLIGLGIMGTSDHRKATVSLSMGPDAFKIAPVLSDRPVFSRSLFP